jgi:hypothetical protein
VEAEESLSEALDSLTKLRIKSGLWSWSLSEPRKRHMKVEARRLKTRWDVSSLECAI